MLKKFLLTIIAFLSCTFLFAQTDTSATHPTYGIETGGSFSYTGFNSHVALAVGLNKNTFLIGPRLVLTDMYLPSRGPWGIYLAYRRTIVSNRKLSSFVGLDYHSVYMRPYNPQNTPFRKYNKIEELQLSYGFSYYLNSRFAIGNSIGTGLYREKYHDINEGQKHTHIGFTKLYKLFVTYNF